MPKQIKSLDKIGRWERLLDPCDPGQCWELTRGVDFPEAMNIDTARVAVRKYAYSKGMTVVTRTPDNDRLQFKFTVGAQ